MLEDLLIWEILWYLRCEEWDLYCSFLFGFPFGKGFLQSWSAWECRWWSMFIYGIYSLVQSWLKSFPSPWFVSWLGCFVEVIRVLMVFENSKVEWVLTNCMACSAYKLFHCQRSFSFEKSSNTRAVRIEILLRLSFWFPVW